MLALLIAIPFALAGLGVAAAMWAVSDEPYEKVAPFKRRDAKTLLSMEDVNAINRAARTFEDLKAGRQ